MTITLTQVKYAAFASEETACYQATICVDGAPVGSARNDGHGGPTSIEPHELEQRLAAHAATLPPIETEVGGDPFTYQPTADSLIDELLQDWLARRDLTRALKHKIVFTRRDGHIYTTAALKPEAMQKALADPGLRSRLKADVILNEVPLEIAIGLWRSN